MASENHLVVVNHTHPEYSNTTQEFYLGIPGENHQSDYLELAERLPEGFDLAFTVSNHFATEGQGFWNELEDEIERNGGEAYPGDKVFRADYEGTRMWGLHSVEAAYEDELDHEYLIHGLPLDDENNHTYDDIHALLEKTEEADLGTVPHPFFMDYDWGEEKRDNFFEEATNYDADLSIEYSQGYGLLNLVANGRMPPQGDNLADLCDKYEVPAVPGTDWHASLPKNIALMDRSAIDSLEDDNFPLDEFRDMRVAKKPGKMAESWNLIRNTAGATATFGDMLPAVGRFMPDSEEFMQNLRDRSLEAYGELDPETVSDNAVRLNGPDSILAQAY
jgi:hypothetical protein